MKRTPAPGEPALIHSTEQTGDVQTFAICDENYNPGVLEQMPRFTRGPVMGYRIIPLPAEEEGRFEFAVARESGELLTRNSVRREGGSVYLHTSVIAAMPRDEAMMVADLEQCAAIALDGEAANG